MSDTEFLTDGRRALASALLLLVAATAMLATFERPHPGAADLPPLPTASVDARKAAFFEFLRPVVEHHNERIRVEREFLMSLEGREELGWLERRNFRRLAGRYGVDVEAHGLQEAWKLLRRRIDVVPPALVMIQAAIESGWGRSRFAQEGNALFGEWCFSAGCGIVPGKRPPGKVHEVRAFPSVHDSVGSYMDNLNSHRSYRELRLARERMRAGGEPLSAVKLAAYLSRYSERGAEYVEDVQTMIVQNDLEGT